MENIAKNHNSKFELNATRNDGALGFFQRAPPPNKKITFEEQVPGPKIRTKYGMCNKGFIVVENQKNSALTRQNGFKFVAKHSCRTFIWASRKCTISKCFNNKGFS